MRDRYRSGVLAVVLAVLVAMTALPVLAQEAPSGPPACPLTEGIVLNAAGDAWGLRFVVSNGTQADSRLGPGNGVIPAGRYNVVLASWDRHREGDLTQPNERWFLEGRNGTTVVFQSGVTPDLPDDDTLIVSTVNNNVEVGAFSRVVARHAFYPDTSSPNSIWPLCASFVPIQEDAGSITVKSVAADDPSTSWAFDLSGSSSTPVQGDGVDSFAWNELGAATYVLTETVLAGWQLDSVSCVSGEEGGATTTVVTGGVSITLEQGEDVTCTFFNSKTTTPTPPPPPSPDPVVIGDLVWDDANADGYQGDFEAGVAGVTVNLLDGNGALVATTVTGPAGTYLFSGIPSGTYSIEIVLPDGYEMGPANGAGQVSLASGQSDLTKDLGIFKTPEVLPQVVTTTAPVTQETLPFTGMSTAGTGGMAFVLILAGGLVLLVANSRRRYDSQHRSS